MATSAKPAASAAAASQPARRVRRAPRLDVAVAIARPAVVVGVVVAAVVLRDPVVVMAVVAMVPGGVGRRAGWRLRSRNRHGRGGADERDDAGEREAPCEHAGHWSS